MQVLVTKDSDIGIITINNPPVNALSPGVPEAIREAVEQVERDAAVRAAVLIGAGRNFVAGADINELAKVAAGKSQRRPLLLELTHRMEDCSKPIVAAIQGNALGGGLELAMGAHYRVAAAGAQVGQPEVKLGIIPGAGGTQRLPRLAGVAKAVEMCAEGAAIKVDEAVKLGIIDRLIEGDLLAGAVAFAREVAGNRAPKTRERNEKLGTPEQDASIFAAARENIRKKQRAPMAALAAIDAVEAATTLPFDESCQVEQKLFRQCLVSEPAGALMHAFLAERELAKVPGISKDAPTLPVQSVAVVGAGTMGGGIAMVFANAGIPVFIKDVDHAALDRGLSNIQNNYATSVKRGRFTQQFVDERLQLIKSTLNTVDFSAVDLVVEAVFEGMAFKKEVFAELDRVCQPGAILATNTSYLDIDEIASATRRPDAVLGLHFFSPANVMRLLEIVGAKATSKQVIATSMQLAKRIGKVGVLVGNCRGFVGNRMFSPYRREAQFLVEEGAEVEAVDQALYDFGMAMGPLSVADLAGLDIGWRMRKEFRHLQKPGVRQPLAEDGLCELGRYGQKTGAGWYKYDQNRKAIPDPEVAPVVRKWAAEKGIVQRQISAPEIVDRCIYAMVNEGARILQDRIALRAGDIDMIYLNGYGFPNYRGGPMWYADTVGLKKVYARVSEFHQQLGELWEPAPLLKQLAGEGRGFADFSREQAATV
ncbi:MAG TPA: 3-hydroxyacyl-CoA dehydrogenase NAD-binding domain-containing protein [Terriglobales bacterium]|nr:3-hydroxyacyl-CoA dehydrogenase NAD-binding domain-containing protein [Terriglobales bacterium]